MGNHNPEVEAWFDRYQNPQKPLVRAVRETILAADERVGETIKWQAPTFTYKGNIASFYPKAIKHVSLMFHTGAQLLDPDKILEGTGDTSRVAKFSDVDDLTTKAPALQQLIREWIRRRDEI